MGNQTHAEKQNRDDIPEVDQPTSSDERKKIGVVMQGNSSRTSDLDHEELDDESSDFSFEELLAQIEEEVVIASRRSALREQAPRKEMEKLSIDNADEELVEETPEVITVGEGSEKPPLTINEERTTLGESTVVRKASEDESESQIVLQSTKARKKGHQKPTASPVKSSMSPTRRKKKNNKKIVASESPRATNYTWKPYKTPKKKKKASDRPQFLKTGLERKLGPRDIGRAKNFKPAKYDLKLDYDPMAPRGVQKVDWSKHAEKQLGPLDIGKNTSYRIARYDSPERERKLRVRTSHKLGPVDIGRNDSYKIARYESPEKEFQPEKRASHKLGPVDIGRNKDYDMPHYKEKKIQRSPKKKAEHKLGPMDIGRNESYQVLHYEEKKKDQPPLKKADHKPGPVDIGRLHDYEVAQYSNHDTGEFLQDRLPHVEPITDPLPRKLGPLDIGVKGSSFEPANYEETENIFVPVEKAERKLGPIETGRLTGYEVAQYSNHDTDDFLQERLPHVDYTESPVPRKLGPLDIGVKGSSFEPADYGDAGTQGLHDGTQWVERIPHVKHSNHQIK